MKRFIFIIALLFLCSPLYSQLNIGGKIKEKTQERVENKTEEGIDKGFDKTEEGINGVFKKKDKKDKEGDVEEVKNQEEETVIEESEEASESATENGENMNKVPKTNDDKPTLQSYTKYDFIPGDQILLFEDFSQDAIGDFPALWSTTGSGEIRSLNLYPGNWLYINSIDMAYCLMKDLSLPENFIFEFDIVPSTSEEFSHSSIYISLYHDDNKNFLNDDLYPGNAGVELVFTYYKIDAKGYNNDDPDLGSDGHRETEIYKMDELNHVIIWVQGRRLRLYMAGQKILDLPTLIPPGIKYNRLRFSLWGQEGYSFLSNIRFSSAQPDTRSKLLTEGKLISYGIYFDSGKDVVKPESYGALNDIAKVLKENPEVKIKIVGHTDSDGDDNSNLDLSKRRAANVKNALVNDFGIDGGRISTDGAGESQPIAPNDNPENKAKNRRVEFIKQ